MNKFNKVNLFCFYQGGAIYCWKMVYNFYRQELGTIATSAV